MRQQRLLLVFPRSFAVSYGDMQFVLHLTAKAGLLNVSLPTVAALTPPGFDIRIIDENHEPLDVDGDYDLVGITGFHIQLERAREIAEHFRARGIPVVCGGPSVSVSPERWRPFADVLMVGEAERTWPRFCQDFLAGNHGAEYRQSDNVEMASSPVPDYQAVTDAVLSRCFGGIVQTSRGCPYECEFCDVIAYVGRRMRYKPVDRIVQEVSQLHALGMKFVVLADDNFTAGRQQAKTILTALRSWNRMQRSPINFATQLTIDVARDEELLELATEAGLNRVLIGIESPDAGSLEEANKTPNLRADMLTDIRTIHEHGIMVMGTSIVGFDHDDLGVFARHYEFFKEAGILSPQPFPLQAPDATPLKERMIREGRYLDWKTTLPAELSNNFNTFTMVPKQMTLDQLQDGLHWLIRELYRPEELIRRTTAFFEQFETSPKRGRLAILRSPLDRQSRGIVGRIARYLVFEGIPADRKLLTSLFRCAAGSSHPQRFAFAVTVFLQAKNVQAMLNRLNPSVECVRYPS